MRAGGEPCCCCQLMVCTGAGLHRLCVTTGGRVSHQEHGLLMQNQMQNLIPWILK